MKSEKKPDEASQEPEAKGHRVETFVRWQDPQGRTGRGFRRPGVEISALEQKLLHDAVKERVNQLCLPSYTASFQRRQVLRAGYPKGRTEVAEEANRFNMRYALAQASIEGRLGFHPPPRANSVSLGQVVRCRAEETTPDPASHARRASDAQT